MATTVPGPDKLRGDQLGSYTLRYIPAREETKADFAAWRAKTGC